MRIDSRLIVLASIVGATSTFAQETTVPRAPIGPRPPPIKLEIAPPTVAIPSSAVRIDSWADQPLNIYFWDGAAWQRVMLETQRSTDITCEKCAGTIMIKYHDGKNIRQVTVKGGNNYVMGWAPQQEIWMLTNPPRLSDR